MTNGDISNYDALQVTLQGRNYHGLSFLSAYTYGHALSESDADVEGSTTVVPDKNNLRLLYGNSAGDLRNRFTFSPSYNIPGIKSPGQMLQGWTVSGILVLQSGQHWSPNDTSSTDYLGTGELGTGTTQTWNYLGKPSAFKVLPLPSPAPLLNPIPCFGKAPGCSTFASNPAATAQCQAAATEPYGGPGNRRRQLALAALANSSCYIENGGVLTPPAYGTFGDAYNGIFRGPALLQRGFFGRQDMEDKGTLQRPVPRRVLQFFQSGRLGSVRQLEVERRQPAAIRLGANFGLATVTPDASNPVSGSGGPRHIQFGLKLAF